MNPKNKNLLLSSLFVISIVFILILLQEIPENKCIFKVEKKQVRGNSLSPLVNDGDKIKALYGYYNCHPIKRNDIVLVRYSGNKYPLIKIVKGIPNDSFHLKKVKNGWQILVNGKVLKNSEGKAYLLNEQRKKMLFLYEKDYHGVIPENAYLVLGNLPEGSMDSTRFGLIGKSSIIAKVEILQKNDFFDKILL